MSMGFRRSQTWVRVLTLCDLGHITYSQHEMGTFIISTLWTVAVRMKGGKKRGKVSGSTVSGTQ